MSNSWKIISTSVIGTAHSVKNLPCQDYFSHQILHQKNGEEILLAIVCDGAGSAKNSLLGAQITCDFFSKGVLEWFQNNNSLNNLTGDFALGLVKLLQVEFSNQAESENCSIQDFACTILAAIISENAAVFFQLGDGAIVFTTDESEDFQLLTLPQQGEYANSTYFVTDETVFDFLFFEKRETRIKELAIFTDGLQRIALDFHNKAAHQPFFAPIFAPLRNEKNSVPELEKSLTNFLNSPKINERTDDDKTLILAYRSKPPAFAGG